jgi:hypothetical protein
MGDGVRGAVAAREGGRGSRDATPSPSNREKPEFSIPFPLRHGTIPAPVGRGDQRIMQVQTYLLFEGRSVPRGPGWMIPATA